MRSEELHAPRRGAGPHFHLIHREAVPLPRKDRVESEEWRVELSTGFGSVDCNVGRSCYPDLIHRKRSPFPYEGKALTPGKMGETLPVDHGKSHIAASEALPRCPAGRSPSPGGVGWRGAPLRTITGADTGFRRTLCNHPRRAKRRAQVCGEVTVRGD